MTFTCKINRGPKFSLICMLIMTSAFFFTEIVVGYSTNSTALVADSFHMLSDVVSLVVGLVAVIYSNKTSKTNTYGWARAEVLGALCNAVFLLSLCFSIVIEAIQRLVEVEPITEPLLVLGVGSAGLAINLIGLLLFHEHAHGHNHSHGHSHDSHDVKNEHSHDHDDDPEGEPKVRVTAAKRGHLNMKGVFLHVLGDALGSVVVIISALIVNYVQDSWRFYVDPVMSLFIALIIVCSTLPLLKQSAYILLQRPPAHINADELESRLTKIKGVVSVHDLHIWQLSSNQAIASAHLTMHSEDDFGETAHRLRHVFHEAGVHSLTLQPEVYPCKKGMSVCGISDCQYLKEEVHQLLPSMLEEIKNNENADAECTENVSFTEYKCCTPPSEHSDNSPIHTISTTSSQICKFSCVSDDCAAFMCCDGVRSRKESTVLGEDNPVYGTGPLMSVVESVSIRL
uniref:zinc homeostasis factor 1 n=1 Tax=Ciona intestinalis TaxID=7719 RepID=UPI000180C7FA|nr:zinc homeostasis factor 1 [Ciona intestinalis]|eukprot:XP_002124636.1 zinc homeostasis factor 1 [Ciona intestinalis]